MAARMADPAPGVPGALVARPAFESAAGQAGPPKAAATSVHPHAIQVNGHGPRVPMDPCPRNGRRGGAGPRVRPRPDQGWRSYAGVLGRAGRPAAAPEPGGTRAGEPGTVFGAAGRVLSERRESRGHTNYDILAESESLSAKFRPLLPLRAGKAAVLAGPDLTPGPFDPFPHRGFGPPGAPRDLVRRPVPADDG